MTFSPPIMVCSWSATSLCLPIPSPHKCPFYLVLCFRTPYWLAVPYRLIQHQSTQKDIPIFESEHVRIITIGTNHRVVFIVFTYHIFITVRLSEFICVFNSNFTHCFHPMMYAVRLAIVFSCFAMTARTAMA